MPRSMCQTRSYAGNLQYPVVLYGAEIQSQQDVTTQAETQPLFSSLCFTLKAALHWKTRHLIPEYTGRGTYSQTQPHVRELDIRRDWSQITLAMVQNYRRKNVCQVRELDFRSNEYGGLKGMTLHHPLKSVGGALNPSVNEKKPFLISQ